MVTDSPSVFGFRIESEVPLSFLRSGGGREALRVRWGAAEARPTGEPLVTWPLRGGAVPAAAALHPVPGGYEYWTTDAGRFLVDLERGEIEVPPGCEPMLLEQRLYGLPIVMHYVTRGELSLHAAAVEVAGRAIILAAPSRAGKTTLAYHCMLAGHRLLSEDLVCCRVNEGVVLPGPGLIRLRPDVFGGEIPAGTRVAAERPDRVFVGLSGNRLGTSGPVPLGAIVFLRPGAAVSCVPADPIRAVQDLWHLNFRLPTGVARADAFRQITRVLGLVPCFDLSRPLTMQSTPEVLERLLSLY